MRMLAASERLETPKRAQWEIRDSLMALGLSIVLGRLEMDTQEMPDQQRLSTLSSKPGMLWLIQKQLLAIKSSSEVPRSRYSLDLQLESRELRLELPAWMRLEGWLYSTPSRWIRAFGMIPY